MKLNNNEWIKSKKINGTKLPVFLGPSFEDELNKWLGKPDPELDHKILEKILSLTGDYDINCNFYEEINDCSVRLLTNDHRFIDIKIIFGDMDAPDMIEIKDGNILELYESLYRKNTNELMVVPYKMKELDSGFEQYYFKRYDYFYKPAKDHGINVAIFKNDYNRKKDKEDYFFVNDEIKKEFKEREFESIIDVYNFIADKASTFTIEFCDLKNRNIREKIAVRSGNIQSINLLKVVKNNVYSISESFREDGDDQALDNLFSELKSIHQKQDEMKLVLKRRK